MSHHVSLVGVKESTLCSKSTCHAARILEDLAFVFPTNQSATVPELTSTFKRVASSLSSLGSLM